MLIKINLLAYWLNGLAYKQLAYGADLSTTLRRPPSLPSSINYFKPHLTPDLLP